VEFTSHTPGTFSWPELATTDQKGAVAFYRRLFDWGLNDQPMGPTETYSMFQMRGKEVGAAYTMRPEERQSGAPPHWNSYVTVKSVDDAVFQVWEPKQHIGAKIMNEAGALCWTELTTSNTKAAEAFYTQLFGWTPKHSAAGAPMEYTEFSVAGTPSIGMMPKPAQMPAQVPSFWMPYFQVTSVDTSASKAKELGGKVMVGPNEIPGTGRFAVLTDPQGAAFAVYQPARA